MPYYMAETVIQTETGVNVSFYALNAHFGWYFISAVLRKRSQTVNICSRENAIYVVFSVFKSMKTKQSNSMCIEMEWIKERMKYDH